MDFTLINLNPNELHYYIFMVSLDRCNGSCNTLDDPFARICFRNKKRNISFNVFDIATIINDSEM